MTVILRRLFLGLVCAIVPAEAAPVEAVRVSLPSASVDRAVQVVTFRLPVGAKGLATAKAENGRDLPLQVAPDGTATFIVLEQKARQSLTFTLRPGPTPRDEVTVRRNSGTLDVVAGGKPAFSYQMDKDALPRSDIKPEFKRAGYLHPISTVRGTVVSDDYPAQHVHHHGIWTPWTKTSFQGRAPDFWNMGAKTGTVEFVGLDWTWGGPVHGGFVARHRFVDLTASEPVTALHEIWNVTAYHVADVRVFDLVLTQVCATNDPLILPAYHYGGFGFRGRGEWYGKDKANFLTSEGTTDRVKMNHERMRWVHLWGKLDSGPAGLTVMGHPENFRAPQPVRVHPSEPYVSFIPSQLGDWQIEPGKPYVARFRFVAFDGEPDPARLEALWQGYAHPAVARIDAGP